MPTASSSATANFADIEQRVLAHIISAAKSKPPTEYDYYKVVAAQMYGVQQHEVTPAQRAEAKAWAYRNLYR